ncbi:MAG: 50S ribosomal protein L24 [Deltaproteobacteria bacterium]
MNRIKKGNLVKVIAGKEKNKTGKVLRIIDKTNRVVVEKLNMLKKHQKPTAKVKGGVIEKEGSIHMSNVMLYCRKCSDSVRITYKQSEDGGKKVRCCRTCNEIIDVG